MSSSSKLLAGFSLAFAAFGPAPGQSPEAEFHKAYYLEVEEGKPEEAIKYYDRVAREAPAELAQRARKRLAGCREEIRSRDLSRLMPPDILAYLELHNAGTHLAQILETTGLTRIDPPRGGGGPRAPFVVSPKLLHAMKDFKAVALAVTNVNPREEVPHGVLVLHPGKDEALQGLIETGLSAGAFSGALQPAGNLHGHASFASPYGMVVVTERLVIAGNPPALVTDAVKRLHKNDEPSLGQHGEFAELKEKRQSSMAFGYFDVKRFLDIAKPAISRRGRLPEEYQIAQALADIESLRWAAVGLGTNEDGLFGDIWLRLDDGNHSLAYHFLRTPPVSQKALQAVPSGAVALMAFALSRGEAAASSPGDARSKTLRYVTGLDIGREIFANVMDVLVFVMPERATPAGRHGPPIPGVGVVFMVKDPSRSEALWNQFLSIPATLIKAQPEPVRIEKVGNHNVRLYSFPESNEVYLATLPDRVILANSKPVMSRALGTANGKGSILDDSGLARARSHLTANSSKIVILHAGRLWPLVAPMAGMRSAEAAQVAALLEKTTITLATDETPTHLHARAHVTLPELGSLVQQLMVQLGPRVRPETAAAGF